MHKTSKMRDLHPVECTKENNVLQLNVSALKDRVSAQEDALQTSRRKIKLIADRQLEAEEAQRALEDTSKIRVKLLEKMPKNGKIEKVC